MNQKDTITAFEKLGLFLSQFSSVNFSENNLLNDINKEFSENFLNIIKKAELNNPWFTPESIRLCFLSISMQLKSDSIQNWIKKYPAIPENKSPKTVGLIAAGNIPLVSFHDILSVLITGHNLNIKLSSKDEVLFPAIKKVLCFLNKDFDSRIHISENRLTSIDAIIATGSNNSSRYFEYYFSKYPRIIRNNKNSIAIIKGDESPQQLKKLADDVFLYFGLGCRSISKIYLPENYNPAKILDQFEHYNHYVNHTKYGNNYDYQRAILLVNTIKFLDNGFLIFRESNSLNSPVGCLNYEFYSEITELKKKIFFEKPNLQCIVEESNLFSESIGFGESQFPKISDYADNMDSIDFLLNLYEK